MLLSPTVRNWLPPVAYGLLLLMLQLLVAVPYVGHAIYLGDQLDQTNAFLLLVKGHWEFFYGPFMSGTTPPAHCLGPLGAVLFGLPTWLGMNPDQLHGLFIVLVSSGILILFRELYLQDRGLAYLWTAALLLMPSYWWHHSMLWANAFLLPLTCIELACFLRLWRKPSWSGWGMLLAVFVFGLHIHSSAILGLVLVVLGAYLVAKARHKQPEGMACKVVATGLLVAATVPYMIAESSTHGANFKAILANLGHFGAKPDHREGLDAAVQASTKLWTSFLAPFDLSHPALWQLLVLVLLGGFCILQIIKSAGELYQKGLGANTISLIWLTWALVFAFQLAFYVAMNRELLSPHYTSFLIPYYAFPWAAVAKALTTMSRRMSQPWLQPGLAVVVALLSAWILPREPSLSNWNYANITSALSQICSEFGSVNTQEDGPFRAYDERIDPLLMFMGKRYVPTCQFSKTSRHLLVPALQAHPDATSFAGKSYELVRAVPPGIGVYREK